MHCQGGLYNLSTFINTMKFERVSIIQHIKSTIIFHTEKFDDHFQWQLVLPECGCV